MTTVLAVCCPVQPQYRSRPRPHWYCCCRHCKHRVWQLCRRSIALVVPRGQWVCSLAVAVAAAYPASLVVAAAVSPAAAAPEMAVVEPMLDDAAAAAAAGVAAFRAFSAVASTPQRKLLLVPPLRGGCQCGWLRPRLHTRLYSRLRLRIGCLHEGSWSLSWAVKSAESWVASSLVERCGDVAAAVVAPVEGGQHDSVDVAAGAVAADDADTGAGAEIPR
mmetsp:Transcript_57907/g.116340  ORF Transcript_57907/g.116340 Transcript_57907/m.116340 type:complete len:219 (-) Transcript_57907:392-1048(-)